MRLLHASEVLGDTENLAIARGYAEENDVDAMVLTGNLLDLNGCITPEDAKKVQNAAGFISQSVQTNRPVPLGEMVDWLRKADRADMAQPKLAAEDYFQVAALFDENAGRQYSDMRRTLAAFPGSVFMVPGWRDSKSFFDDLSRYSLHGKMEKVDGLEFAGFGAGGSHTAIPQTRQIDAPTLEAAKFFMKEGPDVVVTHVAPWSHQDFVYAGEGEQRQLVNGGDPTQYATMAACGADLWLYGSTVHGIGASKTTLWNDRGVFVSNPGRLAKNDKTGIGGTFTVIDLEGNGGDVNKNVVQTIAPYIIRGGKVEAVKSFGSLPEIPYDLVKGD